MTLLNSSSNYTNPSYAREIVQSVAGWLFGLVNRWVARIIAQREHQATLMILRSLSDRELRDIGIYRSQINSAMEDAADAARYRASRQHAIP
jgi:uncharacterized protein YjiS (DUF1127 family)